MARARFVRCKDGDQVSSLGTKINELQKELERLNRMASDGNIGLDNGDAGPLFWLNVPLGTFFAVAKAGPSGITAADWSDPDEPVLGTGTAILFDRAVEAGDAKGKIRVTEVNVESWYHGAVEADWYPIFLLQIGGVWTLIQQDCVTGIGA